MKLSSMTTAKLESLKADIEAELEHRQKAEAVRAEAQAELKALADKFGMSIDELVGKSGGKVAAARQPKVKAKYRNPDNPSQTWTGRGRAPKWVKEAEARLGSRDKLLID